MLNSLRFKLIGFLKDGEKVKARKVFFFFSPMGFDHLGDIILCCNITASRRTEHFHFHGTFCNDSDVFK